jgi:hypothetical protein
VTRTQMLTKIGDAHREWSLRHGDTVPYIASDASPHDGQKSDLSMWQADRSAPPDVDDELNEQIKAILAEGYDEDGPLPDIPDD